MFRLESLGVEGFRPHHQLYESCAHSRHPWLECLMEASYNQGVLFLSSIPPVECFVWDESKTITMLQGQEGD